MTLDRDSLAVLALTNRLVDTDAAPLKASEFWRLVAVVEHPARLLGLDESAVTQAIQGSDLAPGRIVRLLDTGIGLAVRIEGLHERGMFVLTVADERYPTRLHERLGAAAPPVLYCAGDAALVGSDGIGIVGSHQAGPDDSAVTVEAAHRIAQAGLALVCGGAAGLDSTAMTAAYDSGGTTVAVLADSLERAIGRRDHRAAVREGRALLCTPYRPDAELSARNAMGRSKIVYGLSRVDARRHHCPGRGRHVGGRDRGVEPPVRSCCRVVGRRRRAGQCRARRGRRRPDRTIGAAHRRRRRSRHRAITAGCVTAEAPRRSRGRAEQIPPIAGDVHPHRDPSVLLVARLADELHAGRRHTPVGLGEVVDPQEEADPSGVLSPDDGALLVPVRTRQQDAGGRARRADHHPPLRPTVVGRGRRVLDQLEAHAVDEEGDRLVVVVDDHGDERDLHGAIMPGGPRRLVTHLLERSLQHRVAVSCAVRPLGCIGGSPLIVL